MDLSDVRRHHLSLVLDHLVRNGPRSRATLAREPGLTKATVSRSWPTCSSATWSRSSTPLDQAGSGGRPPTLPPRPGRWVASAWRSTSTTCPRASSTSPVPSGSATGGDGDNERARPDGCSTGCRSRGACAGRRRRARESTASGAPSRCRAWSTRPLGRSSSHPTSTGSTPTSAQPDAALGVDIGVDNEANLGALAELRSRRRAGPVVVRLRLRWHRHRRGHRPRRSPRPRRSRVRRRARPRRRRPPRTDAARAGPAAASRRSSGRHATAPTGDSVAEALAAALRSVVHVVDPEAVVLGGTLAALGRSSPNVVADQLARRDARRPLAPVRGPPLTPRRRRRPDRRRHRRRSTPSSPIRPLVPTPTDPPDPPDQEVHRCPTTSPHAPSTSSPSASGPSATPAATRSATRSARRSIRSSRCTASPSSAPTA